MPDLPAALAALSPHARERVVRSLPEALLRDWAAAFPAWAHAGQLAPGGEWRTWVILGGRGFGKTRAGAEWVLGEVRAWGRDDEGGHASPSRDVGQVRLRRPAGRPTPNPAPACAAAGRTGALRVALVGATIDEARAVMVEGPSGLLACARSGEIARWSAAERRVEFANGAVAELFSGAGPAKLRGPEHDLAWADELGKWRHAQAAWDMLQLGLRRGRGRARW